ncbi:DUF3141 domain-containing protein [Cupriavidus basilensis]|uniref:DUF3141 domain-containing protein n=1 Tax=Cupriavidus basilensis TaxID=68895 RepID=UPI003D3336B5
MNARVPATQPGTAAAGQLPSASDMPPLLSDAFSYTLDAWQRAILLLDILRERGNQTFEHEREGMPPVLVFEHEVVIDGRTLEQPANYALLRILPPPGMATDDTRRPFVVIDPRAGHGPGIGGFKIDSEIGIALRSGHPCYFVTFFPVPCPGQTIECVARAEALFLLTVAERHPLAQGKPFVIGNCQGGWALMMLAAAAPDLVGPILLAGSPLAYWSGVRGRNPMRYSGGLLGGSWLSSFTADLGNGRFDGAWLVQNFEQLNPSNTYWKKLYDVYARVDTERERFLEFERWWGGHFLLNRAEIDWIVQNLFVGNHLTAGEVRSADGSVAVDLRNVRSPIVVFASWGDNITPPQQALNWIPDLYASVDEIVANDQVIVYCLHEKVGHLGIFVSAGVANREHTELFSALDLIDVLPPGLYEARIEDIAPGTSHLDLIEGRYLMRFERRTIDDILALDDGRDDERPFEVVRRVAEINQRLYDTFASPAVQAMSNELGAYTMRQMHPARLERSLASDANPWMAWLAAFAPAVREARQPVAPDNPFVTLERAVSDTIVRTLDAWRDQRDALYEQTFEALYQSPWLSALVGFSPGAEKRGPPPLSAALRQELAARRIHEAEAGIEQGTALDAFMRILAYVADENASIEERPFNLMRQMAREHLQQQPDIATVKAAVRRQSFIVGLDAGRAVAALPLLVPDSTQRHRIMMAIHRILTVAGPLDGGRLARYREVASVMGTDHTLRQAAEAAPAVAPVVSPVSPALPLAPANPAAAAAPRAVRKPASPEAAARARKASAGAAGAARPARTVKALPRRGGKKGS